MAAVGVLASPGRFRANHPAMASATTAPVATSTTPVRRVAGPALGLASAADAVDGIDDRSADRASTAGWSTVGTCASAGVAGVAGTVVAKPVEFFGAGVGAAAAGAGAPPARPRAIASISGIACVDAFGGRLSRSSRKYERTGASCRGFELPEVAAQRVRRLEAVLQAAVTHRAQDDSLVLLRPDPDAARARRVK
jgi:hypothetical protein